MTSIANKPYPKVIHLYVQYGCINSFFSLLGGNGSPV